MGILGLSWGSISWSRKKSGFSSYAEHPLHYSVSSIVWYGPLVFLTGFAEHVTSSGSEAEVSLQF